jgi:SAM-dependent methyltransferase
MDDWFKTWFDEDYAALYAHRDEEEAAVGVATALRCAPELGSGPVVDLGCGTGRHLTVLRASNPAAVGLDLSDALLHLTPAELRGRLAQADMRRLPVKPASLSALCLWFTPFGYFSDDDNRALIHALAAALRPGGVLLLDYLNAHHLRRHLVEEDVVERSGLRVLSRRTLEGDRIVKRMTLIRLDSGATREVVESVRIYEPEAIAELAAQAGLALNQALGTYEGAAFAPDSPRWLAFFRKTLP